MELGLPPLVGTVVHNRASLDVETGQIDELFRTLLQSKGLRDDEKKELETMARLSAERRAGLAEARSLAAQQARKMYKCEVCGLEFLGILGFKQHTEASSHKNIQRTEW